MAEIIDLIKFKERQESLPEFTLDYQKTQLLEFLQNRSKVGYTNLNYALLNLSKKDYRFKQEIYFTETMTNKILFDLVMEDKINLRTKNGQTQIKLFSKSVGIRIELQFSLQDARIKANNLWNM
jgi:hypothetical protein